MKTQARVARLWTGKRWIDDALVGIDGFEIRPERVAGRSVGRIDGTLLPPLTDAHVHLGLSDFATRGGRALARVLDLGWDTSLLSTMELSVEDRWPATEVAWAGPFLTAAGGYPGDRPWAPPGAVREIADGGGAVQAAADLHGFGACVVKVALNAVAGPVFSDDTLRLLVNAAHEFGLPVVAHVEGEGMPQLATSAGVDCFAHTPWTPLQTDELQAMVGEVDWISTLDMHGRGDYDENYATALSNLTRFVALGGTVIYGTDLGNAVTTTDLNLREVTALRAANLSAEELLRALNGAPLLPTWSRTATLLPTVVADAEEALAALPTSRPVNAAALRELAA